MTDSSVYILLADGFEELEAIAPADILRRMELSVVLVGVASKQVRGSHGIELTADRTLNQLKTQTPRAVLLPGGMPGTKNLDANPAVGELVRRTAADGGLVGAICAAPMVLGRLGLLNGRRATCFPGFENFLKGADVTGNKVENDGGIITAKGAGAAAEFGFEMLKELKGADTAAEIKDGMQF